MIEARDIRLGGRGRPRLELSHCAVCAGEFVAVLGPNGAGKSTLLRVLAGDLVPDTGMVVLDGKALPEWPRDALARRRAVLGASETAPDWPVREIVGLGRLPHPASTAQDCVARAIAVAGLEDFVERSCARLSAGELARVHFARCLAQLGPGADGLLLMDEPVAHADLRHQHALLGAARGHARQGGAVLTILHEPNQALHYADRVLLMREGRVVGDGPPREVLSPETLTRLYEVEVRRAFDAQGLAILGVIPDGAPRPFET